MKAAPALFLFFFLFSALLAQAAPAQYLETKIVYGRSRQGRPLVAYILGDGPNVTLITGGIHGNETSAPGVVNDLHSYLLAHPEAWTGCRVIIVPNVNPDGDAAHTRADAAGVDLNRNFPYHWAPRRAGVRLETGTGPLSEPEARGLVFLLDQYHPSKSVSVHQPLDCVVGVGPAGKELAGAMRRQNSYRFTTDVGYPTPGSLGSYLWHVRHIAGVTLEMPRQPVDEAWTANRAALLAAIKFQAPPND